MSRNPFTTYSTHEEQNAVELKLLAAKNQTVEKKVRFGFASSLELQAKTAQERTLTQLLENNEFPAIAELYTRYQLDPSKAKELAELDAFLLDPKLDTFWANILEHKTKLRAIDDLPALSRHRLRSQGDEERDLIHPFHMLVGNFYLKSATKRHHAIKGYRTALIPLGFQDYSQMYHFWTENWKRFAATTDIDKECQRDIETECEVLIEAASDPNGLPRAAAAFQRIGQQVDLLVVEQERDLRFARLYQQFHASTLSAEKDLLLLMAATSAKNASDLKHIEVVERIGTCISEEMEIHRTLAFLDGAYAHYWMGEFFEAGAKEFEKQLPREIVAPIYQACGFESSYTPLTSEQLQTQALRDMYTKAAKKHFEKSLVCIKTAITLNNNPENDHITHNALRGRKIRKMLALNGRRLYSLDEMQQHMLENIRRRAPSASDNTTIEEESCRIAARFEGNNTTQNTQEVKPTR